MNNWSKEIPEDGVWCWVFCGYGGRRNNPTFIIAKRDTLAAGGWTNEDCWQDFDGDAECWIEIGPEPAPPIKE